MNEFEFYILMTRLAAIFLIMLYASFVRDNIYMYRHSAIVNLRRHYLNLAIRDLLFGTLVIFQVIEFMPMALFCWAVCLLSVLYTEYLKVKLW